MAGDGQRPENQSVEIKVYLCKYCSKKVVNYVKCVKCSGYFHPKCLTASATIKTTDCKHTTDAGNPKVRNGESVISDIEVSEAEFWRKIAMELEEKCSLLRENCDLLREKVKILEENSRANDVEKTRTRGRKNGAIKKTSLSNMTATSDKSDVNFDVAHQRNLEFLPSTSSDIGSSSNAPSELATASKHGGKESSYDGGGSKLRQLIDPKKAFAAINEEVVKCKLKDIIGLCNDDEKADNEDWKMARGRRRQAGKRKLRDSAIVGTCTQQSQLKAVPRTVSLYATRLAPNTGAADVTALLAVRFPEVKVVEMGSRFPDIYKSFKVTINSDNYEAIMTPEIWPAGTRVDRFFHRRVRKETEK